MVRGPAKPSPDRMSARPLIGIYPGMYCAIVISGQTAPGQSFTADQERQQFPSGAFSVQQITGSAALSVLLGENFPEMFRRRVADNE